MHVQHPAGSKHNGIAPLREIIICVNRRDGLAHAAELGRPSREFIFVTPRSRNAAGGLTAKGLHITDAARAHPRVDELIDNSRPALATRRR